MIARKNSDSDRWNGLHSTAAATLAGLVLALAGAPTMAAEGVSSDAGADGPAQTAYAPAKVPAPVVIVISGQSGPNSYQAYASELADAGYVTVLVAGRDILTPGKEGPANLRKTIDRAQRSPLAVPGKVAVVGFSLGGGAALAQAAGMPELVSVVVAYYPFTSFRAGPASLVKNFRVPVLMLAAELDRYNNCCLIESAQAIAAAAKESGANFELVVYPQANHGFNLVTGASGEPARAYRSDDAADAWRRTGEMLRRYQPLK